MSKTKYYFTPRPFPSYGTDEIREQREVLRTAITYVRDRVQTRPGNIANDSVNAQQILGALRAMGLEVAPIRGSSSYTSQTAAYSHECLQHHVDLSRLELAMHPLAKAQRENEQTAAEAAKRDDFDEWLRTSQSSESAVEGATA